MTEQPNENKEEVEGKPEPEVKEDVGTEGMSIVDEAKKVRDEIRAENDRREQLLEKEQKLKAEQMLAGTAGGRVEPAEPKEETDKEYAERMVSGNFNGK